MSTGQKWAAGLGIAGAIAAGAYAVSKLLKSEDEEIPEKVPLQKENRLKHVGNKMEGKSYINRFDVEKDLLDKTIKECRSVNLAGMRKVGKTSLVCNILEAKTDEYYQKNIVVARIPATSGSADEFFKSMIKAIYEVISCKFSESFWSVDYFFDELSGLFEKIQSGKVDHLDLWKFFDTIHKSGKKVVCVVDEFYNSSELLKSCSGFFAVFKELVTNPKKYGVSFVFISEIPIKELNFIGGNRLYLRGFSPKELCDYYSRNEDSGIILNNEEKAGLRYISGCHPYWSDIILAAYKEAKDSGKTADMETIFREKAKDIYDEFEGTLDSLGEDLKNKLYQIVFGPMDEKCTQIDIDTLYDYGILDDRKNPKIISGKLYEYMKMKERDVNFFPLWHDTETGMRKILKSRLKKVYSEADWEDRIVDKYLLQVPENIRKEMQEHFFPKGMPKNEEDYIYQGVHYSIKQYLLSYDLKEVRKNKENMKRLQDLGIMKWDAEISILEATYTKSLFFLYEFEYEELKLKEIFGDPDKFIEMADHLRNARNTYQHNNDFLLTEEYKEKTLECCKYLLECIKKTRI